MLFIKVELNKNVNTEQLEPMLQALLARFKKEPVHWRADDARSVYLHTTTTGAQAALFDSASVAFSDIASVRKDDDCTSYQKLPCMTCGATSQPRDNAPLKQSRTKLKR